jgi:hypothetical protein
VHLTQGAKISDMRELISDFSSFLSDVFWHWQSWAGGSGLGGAVIVIISLWERATGRAMGKNMYLSIVVGAFLFGAFFMAWRGVYCKLCELQKRLKSPKFTGAINALFWGSDSNGNLVVVADCQILNPFGPSSAAIQWEMTIELTGGQIVRGTSPMLPDKDWVLPLGGDGKGSISLMLAKHLPSVARFPISAGGSAMGWFLSSFQNILGSEGGTISVSFEDAIERKRFYLTSIIPVREQPLIQVPGQNFFFPPDSKPPSV